MGLKASNYNGTCPGFAGHPTYTYRLKEMVNITTIKSSVITISRLKKNQDGTKIVQKIECKIRGINENQTFTQSSAYDPSIKWLKFEKTKYELNCDQMVNWIKMYGRPLTDPEEETEKLILSDPELSDDDDLCSVLDEDFKAELPDTRGTGTYKTKVKFFSLPPQYLPIYGQKVRLHYQGVKKMCTRCYKTGHIKRDCENESTSWITYVKSFMEKNPGIPIEMYGRWWNVIQREFDGPKRTSQPQPQPQPQMPTREEQVSDITNTLKLIRTTESNCQLATEDTNEQNFTQENSSETEKETADANEFVLPTITPTGTVPKKPGRPKKNSI